MIETPIVSQQRKKMDHIRNSLKVNTIFQTNTIKAQEISQKRISKKCRKNSNLSVQSQTQSIQLNIQDLKIHPQIDVKKFDQKYILLQKLGEGANGVVKKCQQIKTNQIYAVKISSIQDQHIIMLRTIFKIVKKFDHPNIIKYKQMYIHTKKRMCYLVMEYISYPSLRKFKQFNLTQDEIKNIIKQLLKSLLYLHSNKICHRDIKPDNILYNRQTQKIIIIDFGISKKTMDRGKYKQMWSPTGTLHYKAPQMLAGGGYDERVDNWAVGVILYQLIIGETPFQSEYLSDQIQKILGIDYKLQSQIWNNYSKFAKDLVVKLLRQRKTRFSTQQALRTAWLLSTNQSKVGFTNSNIVLESDNTLQDYPQLMGERTNTNQKNKNYSFRRMLTMNTIDQMDKYFMNEFNKQQEDIITN